MKASHKKGAIIFQLFVSGSPNHLSAGGHVNLPIAGLHHTPAARNEEQQKENMETTYPLELC